MFSDITIFFAYLLIVFFFIYLINHNFINKLLIFFAIFSIILRISANIII